MKSAKFLPSAEAAFLDNIGLQGSSVAVAVVAARGFRSEREEERWAGRGESSVAAPCGLSASSLLSGAATADVEAG